MSLRCREMECDEREACAPVTPRSASSKHNGVRPLNGGCEVAQTPIPTQEPGPQAAGPARVLRPIQPSWSAQKPASAAPAPPHRPVPRALCRRGALRPANQAPNRPGARPPSMTSQADPTQPPAWTPARSGQRARCISREARWPVHAAHSSLPQSPPDRARSQGPAGKGRPAIRGDGPIARSPGKPPEFSVGPMAWAASAGLPLRAAWQSGDFSNTLPGSATAFPWTFAPFW